MKKRNEGPDQSVEMHKLVRAFVVCSCDNIPLSSWCSRHSLILTAFNPNKCTHAPISIRVSNSFDPDQERHSVSPDMGPNCLQRLSVRKELSNQSRGKIPI